MAITRFSRPAQTRYISQFIPTPLPIELMLKAGEYAQKDIDALKKDLSGVYAGLLKMKAAPGHDEEVLQQKEMQFQKEISELKGKPLTRELRQKVLDIIVKYKLDPELRKIEKGYKKYKNIKKTREDMQKKNKYVVYNDLALPFEEEYMKRGDVFYDDIVPSNAPIYEYINPDDAIRKAFSNLGYDKNTIIRSLGSDVNSWYYRITDKSNQNQITKRINAVVNTIFTSPYGAQMARAYNYFRKRGITLGREVNGKFVPYESEEDYVKNHIIEIGLSHKITESTSNMDQALNKMYGYYRGKRDENQVEFVAEPYYIDVSQNYESFDDLKEAVKSGDKDAELVLNSLKEEVAKEFNFDKEINELESKGVKVYTKEDIENDKNLDISSMIKIGNNAFVEKRKGSSYEYYGMYNEIPEVNEKENEIREIIDRAKDKVKEYEKALEERFKDKLYYNVGKIVSFMGKGAKSLRNNIIEAIRPHPDAFEKISKEGNLKEAINSKQSKVEDVSFVITNLNPNGIKIRYSQSLGDGEYVTKEVIVAPKTENMKRAISNLRTHAEYISSMASKQGFPYANVMFGEQMLKDLSIGSELPNNYTLGGTNISGNNLYYLKREDGSEVTYKDVINKVHDLVSSGNRQGAMMLVESVVGSLNSLGKYLLPEYISSIEKYGAKLTDEEKKDIAKKYYGSLETLYSGLKNYIDTGDEEYLKGIPGILFDIAKNPFYSTYKSNIEALSKFDF